MKLYNKSGRAFIIDAAANISGCRIPTHDINKNRAYIDPQAEVEVKDELGEKLLKMYPEALMRMGTQSKRKVAMKPKPKKKIEKVTA